MIDNPKIHEAHTQVKDIIDALVIRDNELSLVATHNGDIPIRENHGYGIYYRDCRFLSGYVIKINGNPPTNILSSDDKGYASIHMLTNQRYKDNNGRIVEKETLSIRRDRIIPGLLDEKLTLINYNEFEVSVEVSFEFTSDFDDIFTVRGITLQKGGNLMPPQYSDGLLTLTYYGMDGHTRNTKISFKPHPDSVDRSTVKFNVDIKPRESHMINIRIHVEDIPPDSPTMPASDLLHKRIKGIRASYVDTMECCSNVQTNNGIFNKIFLRSLSDLRMLYMGMPVDIFYSAGVPWYDALFGRDSIISAMQVIPYNPVVAKSTLRVLASYQGKKVDNWRDEQPGKILHELRIGEEANLHRIPNTPYYGSVDSTPLFLILIAEYIDWTGDVELFKELLKNVDAALEWIDKYGNLDGSGFCSYTTYSPKGLYNQCWKDSWDSISRSDGSLAEHPIATAEVQGYVYMAKRRIANLYDRIGQHEDADRLRQEAVNLRQMFNDRYWMKNKKYYAQALDAKGQCDVISSNPAQALWSEIIDPDEQRTSLTGCSRRTCSRDGAYVPCPTRRRDITRWDTTTAPYGHTITRSSPWALTSMALRMSYPPCLPPCMRLLHIIRCTVYRSCSAGSSGRSTTYPSNTLSPAAHRPGPRALYHICSRRPGIFPDALNRRLTLVKPNLPPGCTRSRSAD